MGLHFSYQASSGTEYDTFITAPVLGAVVVRYFRVYNSTGADMYYYLWCQTPSPTMVGLLAGWKKVGPYESHEYEDLFVSLINGDKLMVQASGIGLWYTATGYEDVESLPDFRRYHIASYINNTWTDLVTSGVGEDVIIQYMALTNPTAVARTVSLRVVDSLNNVIMLLHENLAIATWDYWHWNPNLIIGNGNKLQVLTPASSGMYFSAWGGTV